MAAPTIDIVERIRGLRYVHVPVASELMAEAASAIETLRWQLTIRENIIRRLVAENERLRNGAAEGCETVSLTDEEREAIESAVSRYEVGEWCGAQDVAATLRSLLERLSCR
jgi:hypothetical protein